jgi:hypothetical protein
MKLRLPRLRAQRRFRLFIADAEDAPPDRWYGSLKAALRAFSELDERWRSLAWIIEYQDEPRYGGIPLARDIVHMRDGVRTEDPEATP